MFFSNWLHNTTINGCLIAVLFCWSASAQHQNKERGSTQTAEAAAVNQKNSVTTHFAQGHAVGQDTYRIICTSPKDKEHADLCQQWRMAEATETSLWLNGLGLLLLFVTFLAAVWAAHAASNAAKEGKRAADYAAKMATESENATDATLKAVQAAIKANDLNREVFITDQRAWINFDAFVIDGPLTWHTDKKEARLKIKAVYHRTGKTPARTCGRRLGSWSARIFDGISPLLKRRLTPLLH